MEKKYLFLIKCKEQPYYDEFYGFVVCAFNEIEAHELIFKCYTLDNFHKYGFTTSIIGEAFDKVEVGVILCDFNAG